MVVVIYSLFVLSYKVPKVSVTSGVYIFLLFWKGDGISYDIRISVGCVEETVLGMQLKCIVFWWVFFFFLVSFFSTLYSHMHQSSTSLKIVYAQLKIFMVNF